MVGVKAKPVGAEGVRKRVFDGLPRRNGELGDLGPPAGAGEVGFHPEVNRFLAGVGELETFAVVAGGQAGIAGPGRWIQDNPPYETEISFRFGWGILLRPPSAVKRLPRTLQK